jgi:outer membrane protein OmpA-like peptidoglycan-associated protein
MMTRCVVEVRVGGHIVGRGMATFGSNGVPSGRVQVHLYPGMRARLARSHRKVTATFVFTAAVRGRRAPLIARQKVVLAARNQWILPSDGLFASRSARLLPKVHRYLRAIAPDLRSARSIRCIGHTDSLGTRAANRRLGLRRARAVCRQLRRLGIRARLVAVSRGETRPRSSNATFNGRRNNRRVELYVQR